jgi:hypothetical protein
MNPLDEWIFHLRAVTQLSENGFLDPSSRARPDRAPARRERSARWPARARSALGRLAAGLVERLRRRGPRIGERTVRA